MITASEILKSGNTAVITGASSGIGRAAALDFSSKGMNVWMVDIDKEELDVAKELVSQKRASEDQVCVALLVSFILSSFFRFFFVSVK